jgi:uncharacterized membrane protein
LPYNSAQGKFLIIKAEMGAPIGNRKVTIVSTNPATVEYVLQQPYEFVWMLCRGTKWQIIGAT